MPAIAPTQARLRWSSSGSSRRPRSNHSRARCASNATSRADGGRVAVEVGRAADRSGVVGRQVDAAPAPVLDDVAEDVRELERDAEVVGDWCRGVAVGGAEDRQRQPADRPGDEPAVDDEVVDRRVHGSGDVHLAADDQLVEGVHRQVVAAVDVGDGNEDGVVGVRREVGEVLADAGEIVELAGRRVVTVADVVDAAGERVDG